MKIKSFFLLVVAGLSFNTLSANLINDMQGCQALIQHIDNILDAAPESYPNSDVKMIRKGLRGYDKYIQDEIVTPGLLKFNAGDKDKAKAMQVQVNAYKESVTKAYDSKFKGKLFSDHAISVNECAKKAVPTGEDLESLKLALTTILKLAQL